MTRATRLFRRVVGRVLLGGVVIAAVVVANAALMIDQSQAAPTPTPANGTIVVHKGRLALIRNGRPVTSDFNGVNAYQLTSDWGVNYGCGYGGWTQQSLDAFFASLHPEEFVRTWFFQSMATNGSKRDWAALDRVIATADRYRVHLVLTLANQNGQCDDNTWKQPAWYAGGYARPGAGLTSYDTWVHDVVARYAGNAAIAVWEPINEPQPATCRPGQNCYTQSTCPDEAAANADLRNFFDSVGGLIHFLDPTALVSDGGFGTGNCGTQTDAAYRNVLASPGLDVATYHDYSGATTLPGDLGWRTALATSLGKATMVGESGVTGCRSAQQRATDFRRKMVSAFGEGVTAYVLWWYGSDLGHPTCNSPIDVDSPTWRMLAS